MKEALDYDMRHREQCWRGKHPLQAQYEVERQKTIDRGKPDPGPIDYILRAPYPSQRLERTMQALNVPHTYRDAAGTLVQKGFALPPDGTRGIDDYDLLSPTTPPASPFQQLAGPSRTRSNTFDARLLGSKLRQRELHDTILSAARMPSPPPTITPQRRIPRNRNAVAHRINERMSLGKSFITADGLYDDGKVREDDEGKDDGVGEDADLAMTATLGSVDPAEGIAAYHERRAAWFGGSGMATMPGREFWRGTC